MTKTRIIIPTTEGLSEIQSLTEEADEIESAMFVDGGLDEPAVSERYRLFVDKRQGVIERETGHGSYRLDVSAEIDAGNSWQLPVYLAHRLLALDMLVGYGDSADRTIVATGEVRLRGGDVSVEKIEHVSQKIHQIAAALGNDPGHPILFLLPKANADEFSDRDLALLPLGTEVISIPPGPLGKQTIAEILSGTAIPLRSQSIASFRTLRRLKVVGLVGLALIGISAGAFALSKTETAVGGMIADVLWEVGVLDRGPDKPANPASEKPSVPPLVSEAPKQKETPPISKPEATQTEPIASNQSESRAVMAVSYDIKMAPLSISRCSALRFQPERAETRTYTSKNSDPIRIVDAGRVCVIRARLNLSKGNRGTAFFLYRAETETAGGRREVIAVGTPVELTKADSFVVELTPDRAQELNSQFSIGWAEAPSEKVALDLAKILDDRAKALTAIKQETADMSGVIFDSRVLLFGR